MRSPTPQLTLGYRAGIHVGNDTTGILHGIHILNNNIHDIAGNWNTTDPQPVNTSAIAFELSDSNTTSGWDDILIDSNTLTKTDAGAATSSSAVAKATAASSAAAEAVANSAAPGSPAEAGSPDGDE